MSLELYYSGNSPFARKVLIVARELGLYSLLKLVPEAPFPTKLLPALNAHNPLATVPTLVTPENGAIFDSSVVVQYLDALSTGPKVLPPATDLKRYEALTYDHLINGTLGAMLLTRYEAAARAPEHQSETWVAAQTAKAKRAILRLSQLPLPDISGPTLPLQAIDLLVLVWYFDRRFPHLKWREWEGASVLTEWNETAEKSKSWVEEVAPPL
ncbi:glutathione S-transferase domain-containing protein [Calocera cornea HHB12733]|uniref:Glutathione S-transferase domain-containing protein n=1 Tax=Calocera cornea HHB12733 TaxID=1353952 RepID=A0A165FKJ0_9BASI|nr:glutathione S-transferase domain-containing protein [Calocera cornea HHB12733]